MRNGVKNYAYQSFFIKVSMVLLVIITIIYILFISFAKKDDIHVSIANNALASYSFKAENTLVGVFEEEKIATPITTDCASAFLNANAMVIGDSTVEGLEAYGILNSSSTVWTRGRTIQYMTSDLSKVVANNPSKLFLAYGANDLLSWNGNVDGYINAYKNAITKIKQSLLNTTIYINSVLPVSDKALASNNAYSYQNLFNQKLQEFCNQNNIVFIDNTALLEQASDGKKFESDGVHPKPFYYKLWANNMIKCSNM